MKPTTSFNESQPPAYSEAQVAGRAGWKSDGVSYTNRTGCTVIVILTTPAAIDTYASAGDPVVTNPSGQVGVKFQDEPGCREALLKDLKNVP